MTKNWNIGFGLDKKYSLYVKLFVLHLKRLSIKKLSITTDRVEQDVSPTNKCAVGQNQTAQWMLFQTRLDYFMAIFEVVNSCALKIMGDL